MKAPVYFYFAVREKGRCYRFRFVKADIPQRSKGGPRPEQAVLEQFASVLSEEILRHPEQWYNYYDFWGFKKG